MSGASAASASRTADMDRIDQDRVPGVPGLDDADGELRTPFEPRSSIVPRRSAVVDQFARRTKDGNDERCNHNNEDDAYHDSFRRFHCVLLTSFCPVTERLFHYHPA